MRTLMLLGSLAMIVIGIFCVANGSAAFLSVAFLIGAVFCLVGALEILIGRRADFNISGKSVSITSDGVIMVIFGVAVLAGQVTDDTTGAMLFALWLLVESVLSISRDALEVKAHTAVENTSIAICIVMFLLACYMFFNTRLLNIKVMMLVGAALILLGLRRFRTSFDIEYIRPGFLTGNQERLEDAIAEEKRALAKAKEGIREQKIAQRRIEKIRSDMEQEKQVVDEARARKRMSGDE